MKKILFLLCLPVIGFGQDFSFSSNRDLIINQILENSAEFIRNRNTAKPKFKFYLKNQEFIVNWNDERYSRWQIPKKTTNKFKDFSYFPVNK